jgi:hypothetical protein
MSIFSKKEKIPELPRAPTLPRMSPEIPKEHLLPTLSSPKDSSIGNQLVKSAVTDDETDNAERYIEHQEDQEGSKKEIFVKLEKFKQAQKTFSKMKEKMIEIEALVNKANQLNEKEKTELTTWEKELHDIKLNMNEVDASIFNQL